MSTDLHGDHLIAGERSRLGQTTFTAVDPMTGDSLAPAFAEATLAEVDRALELAAHAHSLLKSLPRERRALFLDRTAAEIEALGEPLLARAHAETGLPLVRLTMERGRTVNQLRVFASLVREGSWLEVRIDHADPGRQPVPKPDLRRMQRAIGPVVVFGASNFPLAFSVAGGDTASALAAGCPVVCKAHPLHPGTSELVAGALGRALAATSMPSGAFSLVHGLSHEVGRSLVAHPRTAAVGFTGSLTGGKALFDLAVRRPEPIPVYAEMGSTNPLFLLPARLAESGATIAPRLFQSMTQGVGQFCTQPGVVVVIDGPDADRLEQRLEELVDAAPAAAMLSAGMRSNLVAGRTRHDGIAGVRRLGALDSSAGPGGCDVRPLLFATDATTYARHPELAEELFGPTTVVVRCRDAAEMLALAHGLRGQLTATIHADAGDREAAAGLASILEEKAGRIVWNSYPTGVEVCPSMHHGGPFPASTDARSTSVGGAAIHRFTRPICYQDCPEGALPPELRDDESDVLRLVDGSWIRGRS